MKKIFILFFVVSLLGCNDSTNQSEQGNPDKTNSEANVDTNSGDNISPQLETDDDSTSRLKVDTIHSAEEAKEQSQVN